VQVRRVLAAERGCPVLRRIAAANVCNGLACSLRVAGGSGVAMGNQCVCNGLACSLGVAGGLGVAMGNQCVCNGRACCGAVRCQCADSVSPASRRPAPIPCRRADCSCGGLLDTESGASLCVTAPLGRNLLLVSNAWSSPQVGSSYAPLAGSGACDCCQAGPSCVAV